MLNVATTSFRIVIQSTRYCLVVYCKRLVEREKKSVTGDDSVLQEKRKLSLKDYINRLGRKRSSLLYILFSARGAKSPSPFITVRKLFE